MNINKIDEIGEALNGLDAAMKKANGVLAGGPANWYFQKLKEYYIGCMAAAKFQPGDRVRLKEAPNCDNSWSHSKHFLIEGAVGTVIEHDYRPDRGGYVYDVMFDNESRIDMQGNVIPIEKKHTYCLRQKILRRYK